MTDHTVEQSVARKAKIEDRHDGKTSDMVLGNQLFSVCIITE